MTGAPALQFDAASLILLNIIMACMMFGVSLSLRLEDFRRIALAPIAPLAGMVAQFVLLPAATCLFTWALNIDPELALGMILVSACPGGSFSNVMTWLARGNVAVSISMTAVSSLAATVHAPELRALRLAQSAYARLSDPDQPGACQHVDAGAAGTGTAYGAGHGHRATAARLCRA